jgi:nitroreductase
VQEKEEYAAVACAIQNFQLALWSQGVGCQWSTGPIINDPETCQLLQTDCELVAALYIGYPARIPVSKRTPWQEKTQFLP